MNKIADTRGRGNQQRMQPMRRTLLAILVAGCFGPGSAGANPLGAQVINGQASFASQGNTLSITNSPGAIINWQSFSINQGETTRFLQQGASSAVLNRITGQDPSQILGTLQSNGQVFLINPNGILFGQGARIDVNGLVASTLDISNSDFLAGKRNFSAGAQAGSIRNQGTISTPDGGRVYLIAPNVENSGIINAPNGNVLLAAGHSVQLVDSSDPALQVVVSAPADQALNLGSVVAQGGRIGIYGALVNQRGIVNADSAVIGADGRIVLKASNTTLLEAGSRTSATGAGSGGNIQILGQQVGLDGDAQVDASGRNGGGTVLIGGDYQGKNPAVQNADRVYLGSGVTVSADALDSGDGGTLVVWSGQSTRAYGTLSARGGAQAGNGGRIETSGHYLDVAGIRVDAGAAHGRAGSWLLDPYDINVTVDSVTPLSDVDQFADLSSENATVSPDVIAAANADVMLQATHDINFSDAVNITTPNIGLTAEAGNNINVYAPIATQGGNVTLAANYGSYGSGSGAVTIYSGGGGIATQGGAITLSGAQIAMESLNGLNGGQITLLADRMSLYGPINSNGNRVLLAPVTGGTAIDIGTGESDTKPNTLELSNQELNNINGGAPVAIGDANSSGAITIKSMLTQPFPSLSLLTAGTITQDPGAVLGGGLSLRLQGSSITLLEANPTGVIAGKTTSGNFQYHSINGISIETVDGLSGVTVPATANAVLISESNIGQNSPISGGGLGLIAAGSVDLMNPMNNVATISGILNSSGGTGNFSFFNSGNLAVGSVPYPGGTLSGLAGANSDIKLVTGTYAGLTISQPVVAGTVDLEADRLALNSTVSASEASIRPHSGGRPITVGSSVCQALDPGDGGCLSITNLYRVAAGTIGIGRDGSDSISGISGSLAGAIYVAGITSGVSTATDRNAITTRIGLLSGAGISQGSGFGIDVQDLGAIAGGTASVNLTNANNKVSNLAGLTQGGDFAFTDAADINVTTLSGSNSVSSLSSPSGPSSPSGVSYSLAGIDAGSGNIALKSSGAVNGGMVAGNDLSVSAGAGITLVTKVASLSALNTDNSGSSNIHISNARGLSLKDVRQAGTAGGGVAINNVGALTVASGHTVSTHNGSIGLGATGSAAGGETLTVNGSVVTGGNVALQAGAIIVNGLVSGASVTKNGSVVTSESDCSANPSLSGCDAIKSTTDTIVSAANTGLTTETSTGPTSSTGSTTSSTEQGSKLASSSESSDDASATDDQTDAKKDDKKNTSSPEDKGAKKNEHAKKMYCN